MPAGIFIGSLSTFLGELRSFHFFKASCTGGNHGRGINFPLPGLGIEFLPQAQMTSPLDIVYLG